jgi:hypothetical protein
MQFHTIVALLAAGLAPAHVQAAAIPATNSSSLVLYHTRILDVGTLEYWGIPQPEGAISVASVNNDFDWDAGWGDSEKYDPAAFVSARGIIQPRCGSNQVHCANSNLAHAPACSKLYSTLFKNPRGGIDPNVRGVLYNGDGGSCVFSWHHHVPNMQNGFLLSAAEKMAWGCAGNVGISAYATDVSLNGVCTVQCLSSARNCF